MPSADRSDNRPFSYGEHSPFSEEERQTVEDVHRALLKQGNAPTAIAELEKHVSRLEAFGELLGSYPDVTNVDQVGKTPGLEALVDALCETTPVNFEFYAPTRAIVGRAIDMAEMNFYRLIWLICDEILVGGRADQLRADAADRRRATAYKMMVEEILTDIVSDSTLERSLRERAVRRLVDVWNRRLTYQVGDFFPVLEATWEARARVEVVGGTLLGTQELFGLLREGCDPEFVELFTRPDPSEDEVEAFREFLFGKTSEQLEDLSADMQRSGVSTVRFESTVDPDGAPRPVFYEFFRSRSLQASARRLAGLPGPKRTAEGYVLLAFLER